MAKQLDCTTNITSTESYDIHGIYVSPHITYNKLNHLANKWTYWLSMIRGMDWKTLLLNYSIQKIPRKSSSLNLIPCFAMKAGLRINPFLIFGWFNNRDVDNFACFLLVHLPVQVQLDFELVYFGDAIGCQMWSKMNTDIRRCDKQDQLSRNAAMNAVIYTLGRIHLLNFLGNHHAWLYYITIGNIGKDIHCAHIHHTKIHIWLIQFGPNGAKNTDESCHNAVGTVLSPLRNLDITGSCLKWDCGDGFQTQWYPLLAAWVGKCPEQGMLAQILYGACPMCEFTNGGQMGHSSFWHFADSSDQPVYWTFLQEINMDPLHTLGFHPIHNLLWQCPLYNVHWLWQPDDLHRLLQELVQNILNWLLKYLNCRNRMNLSHNHVTLVPRYPGLQRFLEPFDPVKSGPWHGTAMQGMIRTQAAN